ncbi:ribosomal-processing cysteine protease Prp [Clostridium weizhouense]|uniref:Ribosomal processing cysteine protease Prp n=1 Tax=Clostridium weizhouense TaxID=2859781 RepID=A0ABS7AJH1_9CLOT|nr:ribosomal-processing cysteine protease Prp [Clostridium weizhouense]MBW6408812.1 ribosomal-processing cysteine protease Prp [Clostridium weizhouense]
MIKVTFSYDSSNIVGFVINNHALSADRDFRNDVSLVGETFDMICNSVSVLSQSVIIGLDEVLKLNSTYEINDGYLKLDLNDFNKEEIEQSQVLLKTFEKSLESVILGLDQMFGCKKRKEYITLLKEEV